MAVQPVAPTDRQFIQSYGPGRFRVSGVDHAGSVVITAERTVLWDIAQFEQIDDAAAEALATLAQGAEILLIGCGKAAAFLPPAIRQRLRAAGMVADAMDTGAACRTFNVLVAEGRRVAAALIALE